jgi:ubiquinone/menaquinone biosynthesis C-methylase UbiE
VTTASADFDRFAEVYDETRRALDERTLQGIKEMLTKHQCHSILEIGVGTARVALPLSKSGFEITGLDLSKRMMEKAQSKGVKNLILAEGSRAPFKDKSFDATLMVHVLHLLSDSMSVMQEAAKISRIGVFALLRKKPDDGREPRWFSFLFGAGDPPNAQAADMDNTGRSNMVSSERNRFRHIAEKYGYDWDYAAKRLGSWVREYEILDKYPPEDLKTVSDAVVSENLKERISRLEKAVFGSLSSMPEAMRKEVAQELHSFANSHPESRVSKPRHEIYQLAMWSSEKLVMPQC